MHGDLVVVMVMAIACRIMSLSCQNLPRSRTAAAMSQLIEFEIFAVCVCVLSVFAQTGLSNAILKSNGYWIMEIEPNDFGNMFDILIFCERCLLNTRFTL